MSQTIRLMPIGVADGPRNMADDEVLLESALAGVASLRFYGWTRATVSLGYFQAEALRRADPLLISLPCVRRPSGGAALVHHHETTYCLALPPGAPWQQVSRDAKRCAGPTASWLCRMHAIIAAALRDLGVDLAACPGASSQRHTGLLCFQHLTPGDLLIGPNKVVGSAQRRQKGALMQHGSILLAASPYAPSLPGIAELSGQKLSTDNVANMVGKRFESVTGWKLQAADWTVAEEEGAAQLARIKYTSVAWNLKR